MYTIAKDTFQTILPSEVKPKRKCDMEGNVDRIIWCIWNQNYI